MSDRKRKGDDITHVFVYIYGNITNKIFDVWKKSFKQVMDCNPLVLYSNINDSSSQKQCPSTIKKTNDAKVKPPHIDVLVLDKSEFISDALQKLNEIINDETKIVHKEWIIDSLKSKAVLPYDKYILHREQFVSSQKLPNELALSLNSSCRKQSETLLHKDQPIPIVAANGINSSSSSTSNNNSNESIINKLKSMESIYASKNDNHRVNAYRRCGYILSKLPPITSLEQFLEMPPIEGIGIITLCVHMYMLL